jgi:hypothetical protein
LRDRRLNTVKKKKVPSASKMIASHMKSEISIVILPLKHHNYEDTFEGRPSGDAHSHGGGGGNRQLLRSFLPNPAAPFFMAVAVGTVNWLTERTTAPAAPFFMAVAVGTVSRFAASSQIPHPHAT